eukprot:gene12680-26706_t
MLISFAIMCSKTSVKRTHLAARLQATTRFSSSGADMLYPPVLSATQAIKFSNENPNIKFVDGSWGLDKKRDHYSEFLSARIPSSSWFDLEGISDHSSSLPHMLPTSEKFSECVSKLGISSTDHVIVYTTPGCFSAARVWWTFKAFQHAKVSVLDGGLDAWRNAGGPLLSGPVDETPLGNFTGTLDSKLVCDWQQVLSIVNDGFAQILDARSMGRFRAEQPEPRPHLAGGHIPGSLCLPMTTLLKEGDFTSLRTLDEIRVAVEDSGIVLASGAKVVTTCGSGVSAAVLTLAMHLLGRELDTVPIYDGSWTEWGARSDLPITK